MKKPLAVFVSAVALVALLMFAPTKASAQVNIYISPGYGHGYYHHYGYGGYAYPHYGYGGYAYPHYGYGYGYGRHWRRHWRRQWRRHYCGYGY